MISVKDKPFIIKILILVILLIISFTLSHYRTQHLLHWCLSEKLIKHPVVIVGHIISLPKTRFTSAHFNFQLTQLGGKPQHTKLALTWYRPYPVLKVGDRWQFNVKLKPPHGLHNPGSFNYERWLLTQGIRATGYVVNKKFEKKLGHSNWIHPIDQLRQKIQGTIQQSIADKSLAAIINTLTIGSKDLMSSQQRLIFQNTGTAHLMAISGLHVGLIASLVYFLTSVIWCFFPKLLLRIPAPRIAALVALLVSILYGLMVGLSLSTQRAVVMIAVLMIASLFYQAIPLWKRLLFAFVIIIIFQPSAILSTGFWLSFIAVGWIIYTVNGRLGKKQGLWAWFRLHWIMFFGLLPITLYFFQKISLVMLLANIPAIPWIGIIIVPLCLLATIACLFSITLGHFIFSCTASLLKPLWWWLSWLASWPHAVWYHPIANIWILFSSSVAILLLFAPRGWPARWLGLIWALPLFFYRVPGPTFGSIDFTLLDVGQGLAAVVRTHRHLLVYDTGPRSYSGFDAGESVVMPYLRALNISDLDMLMVSHGDNDHIGGAKAILASVPVDKILTSVPRRFHQKIAHYCYQGQHWRWDGVDFTVLSPPLKQRYQGNNSSCVLKISNGRRSILLSGDIEKPREQWLLTKASRQLAADILVAPHHGSKTSSSGGWVSAVNAKDVLFAVGYYNRYGFPNSRVVARYRSAGAKIYTTAAMGAIRIRIKPNGQMNVKITKADDYEKRYCHLRASS